MTGVGTMEEKKVLLSIKDLWVKFRVRGRVLTAIRNVSLDIYENESIAIVGVALFYGILFIISAIMGDILMAVMDPRISYTSKAR